MENLDIVDLFKQWHLKQYPVGSFWYGLSCTDRDRFDMYTNGTFKDPRVQVSFVAFTSGIKIAETLLG